MPPPLASIDGPAIPSNLSAGCAIRFTGEFSVLIPTFVESHYASHSPSPIFLSASLISNARLARNVIVSIFRFIPQLFFSPPISWLRIIAFRGRPFPWLV